MIRILAFSILFLTSCFSRKRILISFKNQEKTVEVIKTRNTRAGTTIRKGTELVSDSLSGRTIKKIIYKSKASCRSGAIFHLLYLERAIYYNSKGRKTCVKKRRITNSDFLY